MQAGDYCARVEVKAGSSFHEASWMRREINQLATITVVGVDGIADESEIERRQLGVAHFRDCNGVGRDAPR